MPGQDGADGAPGADGTDGMDGVDGVDGESCAIVTGPDGSTVLTCPDGSTSVLTAGRRRHVILLIGDGMQLAHEVSASRYLYGANTALSFHQWPYRGFVTTWDVSAYNTLAGLIGESSYDPMTFDPLVGFDPSRGGDRPYPLMADTAAMINYFFPPDGSGGYVYMATDSASSATAMATGVKTDSGNIAWLPGDLANGQLRSLPTVVREELGMAFGVISTVPLSHATPAAFVSHNTSRYNYQAIAHEILFQTKPEVVIAGGHPTWTGDTYLSALDYAAAKTMADGVFVERQAGASATVTLAAAAEAAATGNKRLFGLFGGSGGSFEWGTPVNAPGNPSIPRGSVENPTLGEATTAALTVLAQDPDGLFLMIEQGQIDSANHSNDFAHMVAMVADLDQAVEAVINFVDRPGDALDWKNTTVIVTADHANSGMRFGATTLGKGEMPAVPTAGYVTYKSAGHTNELVTVYARGASSDVFWHYATLYPGKPLIDNTSIFHGMLEAARAGR